MTASVSVTSAGAGPQARGESAFGGRRLLGELLVASAHRDETAFARFYGLTSPWIYYLLRRRTGSTASAEDATCRVYVEIWKRAASFAPPSQSALAWATSVAYDVVAA